MAKTIRAFLLVAAGVASMAAAEPRKPTARWVLNYDNAQCVASRNYGTEENPLFLALKPSPTGSVMRLMLIRNGHASDAEQRPASVQFDDARPISANALAFGNRETRHFMAAINLPAASVAANRRAGSIAIKGATFDERLAVPGLGGVMAAFDECLANLRDVWNIGQPYSSRVKQPARPRQPLRDLFKSTTYPRQAINQGNTGAVALALLIDETGKVTDCMIEETSGFATLDTASCSMITKHARFVPALGADGKPVKSASFHRIKWSIGY